MEKRTFFTVLLASSAKIAIFLFASCKKDDVVIQANLKGDDQAAALKLTGSTSPDLAVALNSCMCEYELLSFTFTPPLGTSGHAEFTLQTVPSGSNGGNCDTPQGTCPIMGAVGFGPCESTFNCLDLITSIPTVPAFIPFTCEVPAFSTLLFEYGSWWWQNDCSSLLPPTQSTITFRVRCQDKETSEGCPGQGYYSSIRTLEFPTDRLAQILPTTTITFGGDCGCDPD